MKDKKYTLQSRLREVLDKLQERIDNPHATLYLTSDLKECWNEISSVVDSLDDHSRRSGELQKEIAEIVNRDKTIELQRKEITDLKDWLVGYKESNARLSNMVTDKEIEHDSLRSEIEGLVEGLKNLDIYGEGFVKRSELFTLIHKHTKSEDNGK